MQGALAAPDLSAGVGTSTGRACQIADELASGCGKHVNEGRRQVALCVAPGRREMAQVRELELKLEFDRDDRQRLEAAIVPHATGRARRLVTTYFDTPGNDLVKAGYTLRVRQDGKRYIQTVKKARLAGAGLFERSEWEQSLAGPEPKLDARSGPIVQVLGARTRDRIQPVFVTEIRRRAFRLSGPDSNIEVAVDCGDVRSGDLRDTLSEVELEHRGGAIGPLFDLARQLNERVPLRLAVRSKSEHGYDLRTNARREALTAEPIALDPEGDARDAFLAIAATCIRHFRRNEAILQRSWDGEALHQARVALRRLRSAFSIFMSLLGHDAKMHLLLAELRWLATALGEARNIDVLMERVDDKARHQLRASRARAISQAGAELASGRTRLLMIDLLEWLTTGPWRTELPAGARANVRHFARSRLEKLRRRLGHDGRRLGALDDKACHRVRLEAKKLRYAAEFFAALCVSRKAERRHRRFIEALQRLQEALGALNDFIVCRQLAVRHGVDIVPEKGSKRLRAEAEAAFDALARAKAFW